MMADQIVSENKQLDPIKKKTTDSKRSGWANMGILFSTLAIVILLGAFGYAYFQLAQTNIALAQALTDINTQTVNNQKSVEALQTSVNTLQQDAQKSADLSAKQEQLIADWQAAQKGILIKWYVAEAQYLVKLANDHLMFTHDMTLSLTLLQRAEQVLQNLPNDDLLDIRKSLSADIAKLQSAPSVNTTALYVQLNGLNDIVDQLPLPSSPLKAEEKQKIETSNTSLPWWKAGLNKTWDALGKIVIVRSEANVQPFVMPEEKIFLYQNLHAQFESTMWSVLHHKPDVYQASLARALSWVQKYFDQSAPATLNMQKQLQELSKINIEPTTITLNDTLQLFDKYFAAAQSSNTLAETVIPH